MTFPLYKNTVALKRPWAIRVEYGEREGSQAAFHDHVAHLADRRKAEHVLDVVLRQHHGGAEDGRERADHESNVQRGRAQPEERSESVDEKAQGIDDARVQQGSTDVGA